MLDRPTSVATGLGGPCSRRRAAPGQAATHEVAIDHVVMHDEGGVQQLERGTDVGGSLGVRAAQGLVCGHDHAGAKTLAADRVVLEHLPQLFILSTEGTRADLG